MRIYRSSKEVDVERARLPSHILAAIYEAVQGLEEIFGSGYDWEERGYVVLVEKDDTSETVKDHLGRFLLEQTCEGGFTRHGCLHVVTLWGNSGDGVTWICPDEQGYPSEIKDLIRNEL